MNENNVIYVVMETDYSYYDIKGYFSNEKEAEQYCLAHPNDYLHIKKINCFDGKEPQNNKIRTFYEQEIIFDNQTKNICVLGNYVMRNEPDRYQFYSDKELRKDSIIDDHLASHGWIMFKINQKENNRKLAEKVAQDRLAQYLLDYAEKHGLY